MDELHCQKNNAKSFAFKMFWYTNVNDSMPEYLLKIRTQVLMDQVMVVPHNAKMAPWNRAFDAFVEHFLGLISVDRPIS